MLGADHPHTLSARSNLAVAYQDGGRLGEAISLFERALADRERVLGADHPGTVESRNDLAAAYQAAGRLSKAIPLFQQALADAERVLRDDHPLTQTIRGNHARARDQATQMLIFGRRMAAGCQTSGDLAKPDAPGCYCSMIKE